MKNQPTSHDPRIAYDALTDAITRGTMTTVRNVIQNFYFFKNIPVVVEWPHLQIALDRKEPELVRLLRTWGAQPDMKELKKIETETPERYAEYCDLLRKGGYYGFQSLTFNDFTARKAAPEKTAEDAPLDPAKIPQEWKQVLAQLHDMGAPEAIIAGGALRDLYNGRPIKDVDIFLAERRFWNRRFAVGAINGAGLVIHKQSVSDSYGDKHPVDSTTEAFNAFATVTRKTQKDSYGRIFERVSVKGGSQAFTIIAGADKTEYNIIFLTGARGDILKKAVKKGREPGGAAKAMIADFDIGICQIAFDGRMIHTTTQYHDDVRNKRLAMVGAPLSAEDHIKRVQKKYSDWSLDAAIDKIINPPPPPEKKKNPPAQKYNYYKPSPPPTRRSYY